MEKLSINDASNVCGSSIHQNILHTNNRLCDEIRAFLSLKSKPKIFISYNEAQQDFVKGLCKDLEDNHCLVFFDKHSSSLPKDEEFSKLILEVIHQCRMAIVVLSEEYFTSKHQMIELNTFVQTSFRSKFEVRILRLFFGISIAEFCNPSKQAKWVHEWNRWVENDAQIKPNEFENALNIIPSLEGIEFIQGAKEVSTYQRDIVTRVCAIISANTNPKWNDSHVQGRVYILKAISMKIKSTQPSKKYGVRILGFYGRSGIGKTTMCKILCNEASKTLDKVCHIELHANITPKELLQGVLKKLANTSQELIEKLNEYECQNILRKDSSWTQKIFLAIDNVSNDPKLIEQVKMFLEAPFYKGSIVIVTSCLIKTLVNLGIDESCCFEVPELTEANAKKLFLYYAAKGKQFVSDEDHKLIVEYIGWCCVYKNEKSGIYYLPLALKVLGIYFSSLENNPSNWLKNISKDRNSNLQFEEMGFVFHILRLNFDQLSIQEQTLFMDIALFHPRRGIWNYGQDLIEWLSLVHNQNIEDIEIQLQHFKNKGLLEDVNIKSREVTMNDLYYDFAKLESSRSRRWMYESTSFSNKFQCETLIRMGVYDKYDGFYELDVSHLPIFEVTKFPSNLVVLKVLGYTYMMTTLNLKGLMSLRSLELEMSEIHQLEGLEDLKSLIYFQWSGMYDEYMGPRIHLDQFPTSLKIIHMGGVGAILKKDVFARCTNLHELKLNAIKASDGILDLRRCTSLQIIELQAIQGLRKLSEHSARLPSNLLSLFIYDCNDLNSILGLEHLVDLQHLELSSNPKLKKLPNLEKLSNIQFLKIKNGRIKEVLGLGGLQQLRELICSQLEITHLSNLSALKQLRYLDLSGCEKLITLGGLPTLQYLNLESCTSLLPLLDLEKHSNLEELNIFTRTLIPGLQEKDKKNYE